MKRTFLVLILTLILPISFVFSQDKSIQGRDITVKANGRLVSMSEYLINVEYGKFIKSLGRRANNIDEWDSDWLTLIDNLIKCSAKNKPFEFKVSNDRALYIVCECEISQEERGLDKNGKVVKGKGYKGNKNRAHRFAILNSFFGEALARGIANAEAARKKAN